MRPGELVRLLRYYREGDHPVRLRGEDRRSRGMIDMDPRGAVLVLKVESVGSEDNWNATSDVLVLAPAGPGWIYDYLLEAAT